MIWEGIKINVKATNVDLSDELHDYVVQKVTNLGKLLSKIQDKGAEVFVNFEVSKTTDHHRTGERLYRADCSISISGMNNFYSGSEQQDLFAAIDDVKYELFRKIRRNKNKKAALWRRGSSEIKKLMKGIIK